MNVYEEIIVWSRGRWSRRVLRQEATESARPMAGVETPAGPDAQDATPWGWHYRTEGISGGGEVVPWHFGQLGTGGRMQVPVGLSPSEALGSWAGAVISSALARQSSARTGRVWGSDWLAELTAEWLRSEASLKVTVGCGPVNEEVDILVVVEGGRRDWLPVLEKIRELGTLVVFVGPGEQPGPFNFYSELHRRSLDCVAFSWLDLPTGRWPDSLRSVLDRAVSAVETGGGAGGGSGPGAGRIGTPNVART